MKVTLALSVLVAIICVVTPQIPQLPASGQKIFGLFSDVCKRDVTLEFRRALYDFSTRMYKRISIHNNHNFAGSQFAIWLSLSAIAEGAEGINKEKLFKVLNLPKEACLRQKYYDLATSLETPGNDVTIARKRLLVIDEGMKLNTTWASAVRAAGLIDTTTAPLKNDTEAAAKQIRDVITAKIPDLPAGNSLIIDSLDYTGMWTTAFSNSSISYDAPFYNDNGEPIGKVDLLKMRKRVKLAHYPLLNAKVLELPVGNNGRYRMLILINLGKTPIQRTIETFPNTIIIDVIENLRESLIPLEIAVPMFSMTSEFGNLKKLLEEMGAESIFEDPATTKYVSDPPATIGGIIQRVTVNFGREGIEPGPQESAPSPLASLAQVSTGLAAAVGRDFIANRPFMYGLVDSQTRTCLLTGAFSIPTKQ